MVSIDWFDSQGLTLTLLVSLKNWPSYSQALTSGFKVKKKSRGGGIYTLNVSKIKLYQFNIHCI
jgi:hypothetical protein